jgi:hypothetical protein
MWGCLGESVNINFNGCRRQPKIGGLRKLLRKLKLMKHGMRSYVNSPHNVLQARPWLSYRECALT